MPYFVERDTLTIIVTAPGSNPPQNSDVIDGATIAACAEFLRHGEAITAAQRSALLVGDADGFINEIDPELTAVRLMRHEQQRASPSLPAAGQWEYRVVPMTENFGLGTARGTAGRMEEALNQLAADGWELVTTSERDSRFMGGETVILTVRRYVVTEHLFAERFRAEERIRQRVLRELATDAITL